MVVRRKSSKSTSQHTSKAFRRATYYLRPDRIRALKLRAAAEDRQLSDVVREAVDIYLGRRPQASGY